MYVITHCCTSLKELTLSFIAAGLSTNYSVLFDTYSHHRECSLTLTECSLRLTECHHPSTAGSALTSSTTGSALTTGVGTNFFPTSTKSRRSVRGWLMVGGAMTRIVSTRDFATCCKQCQWFREHSTWFREHSTWFGEHSTWFREHSTWFGEHSTWFRGRSTWFREHAVSVADWWPAEPWPGLCLPATLRSVAHGTNGLGNIPHGLENIRYGLGDVRHGLGNMRCPWLTDGRRSHDLDCVYSRLLHLLHTVSMV
jgi:hypothetical protein